ncbi:hypothetical protein [Paenarthrobacter aurescens]|nr:hypothetical protein [Paenarthrobacter aurescens]MCT9868096.1 hypothetical protein [Paenarthrobacter aurescens]
MTTPPAAALRLLIPVYGAGQHGMEPKGPHCVVTGRVALLGSTLPAVV